jgi:glycosyltransferase involved in cell wall biosynthesis
MSVATKEIAILIPCYNEELTVSEVVGAFRAELPAARIYVFDNNSTDRTAQRAAAAGAIVFSEPRRGKGFVVQSMFRRVQAEIYVMVDGDGTYPAHAVHQLLAPVFADEADMVIGSRLHTGTVSEFNPVNRWANRLALSVLNAMFRVSLTDILSGYRALNHKLVKSLPVFGGGFEIETELTIKAVLRGFRIVEVPAALKSRPAGSHSKIKFFRDGFIILNTILALFRDHKPLTFFGSVGALLVFLGFVPGVVVIVEFIRTGFVLRLPLVVLTVGLVLAGMLLIMVGVILHTIVRRFQELEHTLEVRTEPRRDTAPLKKDHGDMQAWNTEG